VLVAARYPAVHPETAIIVTARDEADRLPDTLAALRKAFPDARIVVGDDASSDGSADVARAAGAEVVRSERRLGKGGIATLAAKAVTETTPATVVLADGDLGASALELPWLVNALEADRGDLAVAAFARRVGGGFGIALRFARWAIRRRTGLRLSAPISGQRAMPGRVLELVLPFAPGFGMEIGMTIDAARAGFRVVEVELDLSHRATGRTAAGFLHRGRQLRDFARVYISRR
jgi:glycosyltransferase involved in cell wall biosynthesis